SERSARAVRGIHARMGAADRSQPTARSGRRVRGGRADRATRRAGRGCGGARGGGLAESRRVAPRGRGRSPLRAGVPDRALHCADARLDRQALIARVLALSLLATGSEEIPAAAEHGLLLELDACLQVDEPSVQNLVELELRD